MKEPTKPQDPELLRQLSALMDGELAPEAARRLKARLAGDAEARQAREELQALDDLLGQWPAPAPVDLRCSVMARVREDLVCSAARRPRQRRWAAVAWAASWVMGGVLTGLTLWSGIDHRLSEEAAAETLAQDMTLSMIMTEDWTPPIAIEEEVEP